MDHTFHPILSDFFLNAMLFENSMWINIIPKQLLKCLRYADSRIYFSNCCGWFCMTNWEVNCCGINHFSRLTGLSMSTYTVLLCPTHWFTSLFLVSYSFGCTATVLSVCCPLKMLPPDQATSVLTESVFADMAQVHSSGSYLENPREICISWLTPELTGGYQHSWDKKLWKAGWCSHTQ